MRVWFRPVSVILLLHVNKLICKLRNRMYSQKYLNKRWRLNTRHHKAECRRADPPHACYEYATAIESRCFASRNKAESRPGSGAAGRGVAQGSEQKQRLRAASRAGCCRCRVASCRVSGGEGEGGTARGRSHAHRGASPNARRPAPPRPATPRPALSRNTPPRRAARRLSDAFAVATTNKLCDCRRHFAPVWLPQVLHHMLQFLSATIAQWDHPCHWGTVDLVLSGFEFQIRGIFDII